VLAAAAGLPQHMLQLTERPAVQRLRAAPAGLRRAVKPTPLPGCTRRMDQSVSRL